MTKKITQSGSPLLILALTLITLGITPFYSYDPINIFRFMAVLIFGLSSIGMCLKHYKILLSKVYRKVLVSSFIFLIWIIVISINSNMNFPDTLFGVSGRNTGLLTYISLLFLMLFASLKRNILSTPNVIHSLFFCGMISVLYGLIQALGLDPFDWINPYSPVFGVFGNPNFQASFIGLNAIAVLAYTLQKDSMKLNRIICLIYISLCIFVIYLSKSQQGYLVFGAGASIVIYFWIKTHSKLLKFTHIYILIWFTGVLIVIFDILQKGPWQSILYKPSVTFRGDFWRAGWNITKGNPIFGVGLDGYRDNFRLYRDQIAAQRDPVTTVDSAHNVFLDISSGGGFPLLVMYCALILLVVNSILKVIRREKEFNYIFAAASGVWLAYQAQSVISINQIGLAIWGWVLSGAIIGYEINTRNDSSNYALSNPATERISIAFGFIIGIVVSIPLLLTDGQFRSYVKAGDVINIEKNLDKWPQSITRINLATDIFIDGGFADRALIISQKAVKLNPRSFEAWEMINLNPKSDENTKAQALSKMRELDPFNPNIK